MTTHSMFKVLPLVAASAALLASASANAMTFALDDLSNGAGYDFILADNGPGDMVSDTGTMAYFGTLGIWSNLAISISKQTGPNSPMLSLKYSASSTAAGQLAISVWDSYSAAAPTALLASLGVTQRTTGPAPLGPISGTFTAYAVGSANASLGGTSLGSSIASTVIGPFSGLDGSASSTFALSPSSPGIDIGMTILIAHNKAGDSGFTAVVTPVPIPAAALLFGSGLLGMVGIGRRKLASR